MMFTLEIVRLALRTLRDNLFRTFLTTLSVTIGAFSIVTMLSLAESGHHTLSRAIEEIGGSRLVLWIPSEGKHATGRERAIYDRGFTDTDMDSLREVPYLAQIASESTYGTEQMWATADQTASADIVGVRQDLLGILSWPLREGRPIDETDNLEKRRVAVLTSPLAEDLFDKSEGIIGQTVFIGRKPYVVVGVLAPREMMGIQFGFSWERSVFVPQLTAERRDGRPEQSKFFVGLSEDPKRNDTVVQMANAVLLRNHRGVEDFESLDFGGFLEQFYTFFRVLDLIVALIAGISLVAGGIGVMNIMLVSVTERVREIGVRRALGASRPQILSQFLVEATVLSLSGGLVGILAGLLVTAASHALVRVFLDTWLGSYSVLGIALSLSVTAGIGVSFGAVPAWRAARLDIVECLRR